MDCKSLFRAGGNPLDPGEMQRGLLPVPDQVSMLHTFVKPFYGYFIRIFVNWKTIHKRYVKYLTKTRASLTTTAEIAVKQKNRMFVTLSPGERPSLT